VRTGVIEQNDEIDDEESVGEVLEELGQTGTAD
jgi:hypothetical protein